MPGSFLPDFDHAVRPTVTRASARPSLYIPPQSPSASSSLSQSYYSIPPSTSNFSNGARKRPRYDRSDSSYNTPRQTPRDESQSLSASFDPAQSPAPFVNTNYRIAGGLDTPTAAFASIHEGRDDQADLDYRPSRFNSQGRTGSHDYFPYTPDALDRERNGRKRALPSPQNQGWGKAVFGLVGDVAGKVINFCFTGTFRGFHAGGGRGYNMDVCTPVIVEHSTWTDLNEKEDVFNENYQRQHYRGSTPVPGEFPEENFIEDYMSQPQYHQARDQPTPIQHDYGGDGAGGGTLLKENWVMVKGSDADSRESSPTRSARKIPRTSTLNQTRPVSRFLTSARPRLAPSRPSRSSFAGSANLASEQHASFASTRASTIQYDSPARPQTSEGRHRRSHSSIASPQRQQSVRDSPASPEVQKFEKRIRMKEKAQEDSLRRLNQQAKDMIREAREALGTRIDIDDDPGIEDEGYGEGTEMMGESKW